MADPQRPHHRGNHNDIEKTLTDTQLAEPTRTMDERGNDETIPDSSGKSLMQQTELSQQCCYSPEEEEELRELEMQMQNIEDGHNSDPYLEHMKADRIVQIKNTMEYIIGELEQIKEENPWEKLGYAAWYRKLSALNRNAEMGTTNMTTIAHMAETNAYLTKRINTLETKLTHDTQATAHDPNMVTTPMNGTNQTWATVAAKLANLKQPTPKTRPTQIPANQGASAKPMVDPRCLII